MSSRTAAVLSGLLELIQFELRNMREVTVECAACVTGESQEG